MSLLLESFGDGAHETHGAVGGESEDDESSDEGVVVDSGAPFQSLRMFAPTSTTSVPETATAPQATMSTGTELLITRVDDRIGRERDGLDAGHGGDRHAGDDALLVADEDGA